MAADQHDNMVDQQGSNAASLCYSYVVHRHFLGVASGDAAVRWPPSR